MNKQRKIVITTTYNDLGVIVDTKAEEVVMCKDCKYHYSWKDVDDCFFHACERWSDNFGYDADVDVNDFCSYGERAKE